jgi:hypothetical protein
MASHLPPLGLRYRKQMNINDKLSVEYNIIESLSVNVSLYLKTNTQHSKPGGHEASPILGANCPHFMHWAKRLSHSFVFLLSIGFNLVLVSFVFIFTSFDFKSKFIKSEQK